MTRGEKRMWLLAALALAILAPVLAATVCSLGEIRATHAKIHDAVIEADRTELHESELRKMEGNAGSFLQFAHARLYFMAPDGLRMEGRRGLIPVTVVVNGNIQLVRFGLGIKNRRDLSTAIRRKPTALEFGLLAGDIWQDYNVTEI